MNLETVQISSLVDGIYTYETKEISGYLSACSLIKYRVLVEIKWLEKILLSGKL